MKKHNVLGIIGGSLAVGMLGIITALNLSTAKVPTFAEALPSPTSLHVCPDVPERWRAALPRAVEFWRDHGIDFVVKEEEVCEILCEADGQPAPVPCFEGGVALTLRSEESSSDHPGATAWAMRGKRLEWSTVLVPNELVPPAQYGDDDLAFWPDLPEDAYPLTLTHELGHASGHDHTQTGWLGSKRVVSRKTGEVMNPRLPDFGWGDQGLKTVDVGLKAKAKGAKVDESNR